MWICPRLVMRVRQWRLKLRMRHKRARCRYGRSARAPSIWYIDVDPPGPAMEGAFKAEGAGAEKREV
jgi:hypothetical protein